MTRRQAPYRHSDGSNCYTVNCSLGNQSVSVSRMGKDEFFGTHISGVIKMTVKPDVEGIVGGFLSKRIWQPKTKIQPFGRGEAPSQDCDQMANATTLAAYELHAEQYIERTSDARSQLADNLISLVPEGSSVLELGSGPGHDAAVLEEAGLVVTRTDGAESFVKLFHERGLEAQVLDITADNFGGPFDAVFANAVLLHVARSRLHDVLMVTRRATRVGGVLVTSFKKGDGDEWSGRKLDAPRYFTYWQEEDLRRVVVAAGWTPLRIEESTQLPSSEKWITVVAQNNKS